MPSRRRWLSRECDVGDAMAAIFLLLRWPSIECDSSLQCVAWWLRFTFACWVMYLWRSGLSIILLWRTFLLCDTFKHIARLILCTNFVVPVYHPLHGQEIWSFFGWHLDMCSQSFRKPSACYARPACATTRLWWIQHHRILIVPYVPCGCWGSTPLPLLNIRILLLLFSLKKTIHLKVWSENASKPWKHWKHKEHIMPAADCRHAA